MSLGTSENSDGLSMLDLASDCAVDLQANDSCNPNYVGFRTPKLVVAANNNFGPAEQTVGSPAAAVNVIGVGALVSAAVSADWSDGSGETMAAYSGRGLTRDGRIKPNLTAPGSGITAPAADLDGSLGNSSYKTFSGTSMASPYVAGSLVDAHQDRALLYSLAFLDLNRGDDAGCPCRQAMLHLHRGE